MSRRAGALALAVAALLAPPALAHEGNPNYRSTVRAVDPASEGLSVQVLNFDDRLELRNDSGRMVTIMGYGGEPYARLLADGTVQVNRRSPASYLNEDRFADAEVPQSADSDAAPVWRTLDGSGRFDWHDHRAHWMGKNLPPQVEGRGRAHEGLRLEGADRRRGPRGRRSGATSSGCPTRAAALRSRPRSSWEVSRSRGAALVVVVRRRRRRSAGAAWRRRGEKPRSRALPWRSLPALLVVALRAGAASAHAVLEETIAASAGDRRAPARRGRASASTSRSRAASVRCACSTAAASGWTTARSRGPMATQHAWPSASSPTCPTGATRRPSGSSRPMRTGQRRLRLLDRPAGRGRGRGGADRRGPGRRRSRTSPSARCRPLSYARDRARAGRCHLPAAGLAPGA